MHDPMSMGVIDCPCQRLDQLRRRAHRLGRARDLFFQAAAFDEFESQIRQCGRRADRLPFTDLKNLHNIGVLKPGDELGFAAETG